MKKRITRFIKVEKCKRCKKVLPDSVMETREAHYFELVTYCSCGATYID